MEGDLEESCAGVLSLERCHHLESITHYKPIANEIQSRLQESNPRLQIVLKSWHV